MSNMPLAFERSLYQAVIRFKAEHQELLDEKTRARKTKESEEKHNDKVELCEQ